MENHRILFFISSLRGGGAENHLLNLCRYLKDYSYHPAVCTLSAFEDGLEKDLILQDITLFRLPLSSLGDLLRPKSTVTIRRLIHSFRPDLIHSHLFHAEVAAALAATLAHLPALTTRHSSGLEFARWRSPLIKLLRSRFKRVIAVSSDAAREARRQGFPERIVTILPNAVDTRRFKPLEPLERDDRRRSLFERYFPGADPDRCLVVGAVGGLKEVKNYPLFIRMAARLDGTVGGSGHDLRYLIIGEGSEHGSLVKMADDLGIDRTLAMPGHLDTLERIYPLLDLFVLPSLTEGVPLALLEAMASGLACIASAVGDVAPILADTGILLSPGDENGFSQATASLLRQPDRRQELGRRARIRVLKNYDTDIWGDRIINIYSDLLGQRR